MPALAPITIAGLADKTGIEIEIIREYERLGFIPRPRRGPGGYWLYRGEDVDVLTFISRANQLGFSLETIAELLDLAKRLNDRTCQQVYDMAVRRLADIRSRIDELKHMEQALASLATSCSRTTTVGPCPIIASLSRPR